MTIGAGVVLGISGFAAPLAAHAQTTLPASAGSHAVFVQTNDPTGNQIVSYRRGAHGQLAFAGRYNTGGIGVALDGAVVDKLASQGSLVYDAADGVLVTVNGGSNSITEFQVSGTRLSHRITVGSGGTIPVSVTASGGRIYVLNAGGAGSVQGFDDRHAAPDPGQRQIAGADTRPHAAVPQHPGPDRPHAERTPARRDDQGKHERDRRVPGLRRRGSVFGSSRDGVGHPGSVRLRLRPRR